MSTSSRNVRVYSLLRRGCFVTGIKRLPVCEQKTVNTTEGASLLTSNSFPYITSVTLKCGFKVT